MKRIEQEAYLPDTESASQTIMSCFVQVLVAEKSALRCSLIIIDPANLAHLLHKLLTRPNEKIRSARIRNKPDSRQRFQGFFYPWKRCRLIAGDTLAVK